MHQPHLALVVVLGDMPGATIIPKSNRARLPIKLAGKLWLINMGVKKIKQGEALFGTPALKANGMAGVYIKYLATALGMANHNRVSGAYRKNKLRFRRVR